MKQNQYQYMLKSDDLENAATQFLRFRGETSRPRDVGSSFDVRACSPTFKLQRHLCSVAINLNGYNVV
jgi:hypothetical protein